MGRNIQWVGSSRYNGQSKICRYFSVTRIIVCVYYYFFCLYIHVDIAVWVLNKCALSRPPSLPPPPTDTYVRTTTDLISAPIQVKVVESKTVPPPSIEGSMEDLVGPSRLPQQVSIEETDFGGNGNHLNKVEGK